MENHEPRRELRGIMNRGESLTITVATVPPFATTAVHKTEDGVLVSRLSQRHQPRVPPPPSREIVGIQMGLPPFSSSHAPLQLSQLPLHKVPHGDEEHSRTF